MEPEGIEGRSGRGEERAAAEGLKRVGSESKRGKLVEND